MFPGWLVSTKHMLSAPQPPHSTTSCRVAACAKFYVTHLLRFALRYCATPFPHFFHKFSSGERHTFSNLFSLALWKICCSQVLLLGAFIKSWYIYSFGLIKITFTSDPDLWSLQLTAAKSSSYFPKVQIKMYSMDSSKTVPSVFLWL